MHAKYDVPISKFSYLMKSIVTAVQFNSIQFNFIQVKIKTYTNKNIILTKSGRAPQGIVWVWGGNVKVLQK